MSRHDNTISEQAWEELRREYESVGRGDADDHDLAEILRRMMQEVEGL